MANLKFSGFTAAAAIDQTDSFLVGFDTDGGGANPTNNKWTFPEVAAGLEAVTATPYSIYAADGTIGTTRKALITDTIQFRNSGDSSDVLSLNTDGTFTIGLGATAGNKSAVAVGEAATAAANAISIGYNSSCSVGNAVSIGGYSSVAGDIGLSIGYDVDLSATADNSIGIGHYINATGANSITFNATGVNAVATSTQYACGVYMTSNTTPDFEVVGSGTSTLNTNFKITGIGAAGDYIIKNAGNDADAYTVYMTDGTGQANVGAYGGINFISRYGSIGSTASYNNLGDWSFERNVVIKGQTWGDLYDGGTIADAGTYTPDWNNGNVQKITIVSGGGITIANGTGGTVTWAGKYRFPAGTAPTLTSGAGKADVITMISYNSTSVLCSSTLDFLTT